MGSNEIDKLWPVIKKAAHLDNLRLHDLRHSFASIAINNGIELRSIGGLLGHSDINTTAGYAHLDKKAEQDASQRVARKFDSFMSKPTLAPERRFATFIRSKQSVDVFCAQWGFETDVFLRDLRAWRKARKGAQL
nr:tyrosine-type recombinase/integrase [Halocynthiibacter namhaensis]